MNSTTALFYVFSAVLLGAGFGVITARSTVHAALYLVLAFFSAACVWMLLRAEFSKPADIVRSVTLAPTMDGLAVLATLVVIRTFLSWSLALELDGRWPWQRHATTPAPPLETTP